MVEQGVKRKKERRREIFVLRVFFSIAGIRCNKLKQS
jgi:hypothetical protein